MLTRQTIGPNGKAQSKAVQQGVKMAILRIKSVKSEFGHRSNSSIYQQIRAGLCTKPVPIGQRSVGWPENEIKAIAQARIAGRTEAEICELVKRLHEQRADLASEAATTPATV
jgi:prophage regulatory protein